MRTHSNLLGAIALSALLFAGCGDDSGAADASPIDAPPPGGTFSLTWSVSDGTNPLLCSDVAAISVSATVIQQGAGSGSVDAFACSGGQATSRQFPPGTYDLTIDLRASGSRSLIAAPVRIADVQIVGGSDAPVAAQTFVVAPTGGFTFMVDGQATAGNCETIDNNGAGIVGFALDLTDQSDVCVPATFSIAAGAVGVAGTYTTDCTTPTTPHACIYADQLITVNPITSGPLELTITGQKNGQSVPIDCYDRVSTFSLAGAMLVSELGSLPLVLAYSLECDPNFMPIDGGTP
jgi:hypothetical protein